VKRKRNSFHIRRKGGSLSIRRAEEADIEKGKGRERAMDSFPKKGKAFSKRSKKGIRPSPQVKRGRNRRKKRCGKRKKELYGRRLKKGERGGRGPSWPFEKMGA